MKGSTGVKLETHSIPFLGSFSVFVILESNLVVKNTHLTHLRFENHILELWSLS